MDMIIAARIIVIIAIVITIIIIIIIIIIIATIYTIFTLPFEKKKTSRFSTCRFHPPQRTRLPKELATPKKRRRLTKLPGEFWAVGIFSPKIAMIEGFFRPSQSWEVFSLDSGGTAVQLIGVFSIKA